MKKMSLLKEIDMDVRSQKNIADEFQILTSVLNWNFKLYEVLIASKITEFK